MGQGRGGWGNKILFLVRKSPHIKILYLLITAICRPVSLCSTGTRQIAYSLIEFKMCFNTLTLKNNFIFLWEVVLGAFYKVTFLSRLKKEKMNCE